MADLTQFHRPRYRNEYHLFGVVPLNRKVDAVYRVEGGGTRKVAVIGIQLFRTTVWGPRPGGEIYVGGYRPEGTPWDPDFFNDNKLEYSFLERPDDGGRPAPIGPNQSRDFLGYEVEGEPPVDWEDAAALLARRRPR